MLSTFDEKISKLLIEVQNRAPDKSLTRLEMIKYLDISENRFVDILKAGLPSITVGQRARFDKTEVMIGIPNWRKKQSKRRQRNKVLTGF